MSVQQKKSVSVIETLEGRQFLSASPALAVDASAAHGGGGSGAGKVSMQDFHFVMKVNKASPKLFAAQDGAAGISFVSKPTKHTPGLTKIKFSDILVSGKSGDGDLAASAGKVSVQDISFVQKMDKASPKL